MSCAGVTDSVAGRDWICRNCAAESTYSYSITSSVQRARTALRLRRLEEERMLEQKRLDEEKRFLKEKYRLMEEDLNDQDERASGRSRVSRRQSLNQVRQWISQNADRQEGAEG